MGTNIFGRIALMSAIALGSAAHPALAQTVTWVTPPPATAPSGGSFTVQWEASGFVGPFISNAVAWGQTSLLGQTPGTLVSGNTYEALVTLPMLHGAVSVVAFAEAGTSGQVLSPIETVDVSLFDAVAAAEDQIAALQAALVAVQGTANTALANAAGAQGTADTALANANAAQATADINTAQIITNTAAIDANTADILLLGPGNTVLALDGFLSLDTASGVPVARFDGVNVQVTNGTDDQTTRNGLGNLIVGYNLTDGSDSRGGSHNLVIGSDHTYSGYGGLVAGTNNAIAGVESNVTGGWSNAAVGFRCSVTGGALNRAEGTNTSISGGRDNTSNGTETHISGGRFNTTGGDAVFGAYASIAGGDNLTNLDNATVLAEGTINPPD